MTIRHITSLAVLALAARHAPDDAEGGGNALGAAEAARVENVKQAFLSVGRDIIARELSPLRDWAGRTMSQDAHVALQAIDRVGTGLLNHIMNALHPYGMDNAVAVAAAAAANEAAALAEANKTHEQSLALEAAQVAGAVVEAVEPAAAPVVAVAEAVIDPLLASAPAASSPELTESNAQPAPSAPSDPGSSVDQSSTTPAGEPEQPDLPLTAGPELFPDARPSVEGSSDPQSAVTEPSPASDAQPQG